MGCSRPRITLVALLALLTIPACGDLPAAPERAAAATVPPPDGTDTLAAGNRQLLLAVMDKLEALEARYDTETRAVLVRMDTLLSETLFLVSQGESPGSSRPGGIPPGVPHQLAEIRAQLALLDDKINDVTVGIGLPAPPGSDVPPGDLFQMASRVCLNLGTSGNVNLDGKFRTRTEGRGGAGIDFYGNKLLVEVRGDATGMAGAHWSIIEGGVNYSFCVNATRTEAEWLMAALPFRAQEFEARYRALAGDMGSLRTNPVDLISPNFSMFGLANYPARGQLINRLDGFFNGLSSDLCADLKRRFNVREELGLGTGALGGIVSPGAEALQAKFSDRC